MAFLVSRVSSEGFLFLLPDSAVQGKDTYPMTPSLWTLRYLVLQWILQTDSKAGSYATKNPKQILITKVETNTIMGSS